MTNIYFAPHCPPATAPPPPGAVEAFCWGCRSWTGRIVFGVPPNIDDLCPDCFAAAHPERVMRAEPVQVPLTPRSRVAPLVVGLIAAAAWVWRRW